MHIHIIDALSIAFRAYYAHMNHEFSFQGKPTSVIFGFLNTLLTYIQTCNVQHLIIAFDSGGKTIRHDIYDSYKQHRDAAPEDFSEQIHTLRRMLDALGIHSLSLARYEADDIIATIVHHAMKENIPCSIFSSDKDLTQLINSSVKLLRPLGKGADFEVLGVNEVKTKWGVEASQMQDYLALAGDASDNIPGVRGIGKVSAQKLLHQFASLKDIYQNIEKIQSNSIRNKLLQGKDSAWLSNKLVALYNNLDIPFTPLQWSLSCLHTSKAQDLFFEYGITRIFSTFETLQHSFEKEKKNKVSTSKVVETNTALHRSDAYKLIRTQKELDKWIQRITNNDCFAFDTETDSKNAMQASLIGFSIADGSGAACYVPLRGPQGAVFHTKYIQQSLEALFQNPHTTIIGHNIKYDIKVLMRMGIRYLPKKIFDTMVAAWLLDSTRHNYSIDSAAEQHLSYKTIHFHDLEKIVGKKDFNFSEVPLPQACQYAAEDADITYQLYKVFQPLLVKKELNDIFYNLEMPLTLLLSKMEYQGMNLQTGRIRMQSSDLAQYLHTMEKKIYELCGKAFNINSPRQLQDILFNERKLPVIKKTKTGYSTDIDTLRILATHDPLPEHILHYRMLSKLRSTYLEVLPNLIHPITGKIHTTFQQTVTATGRLSSTTPNLQNIPIKSLEGKKIRYAFTPDKDWVFIGADYSQIELVVLAHFSQDETLCAAFRSGQDIHTLTAASIFSQPLEAVSTEHRRIAKAINFGVIYGMSAFRLANELRITRKKAQEFIQAYFSRYSAVQQFRQEIIEEAHTNGYVRTIKGRVRPLPQISSNNHQVRSAQERIALNTIIQGSAADIIKQAMLDIDHILTQEGLQGCLVLQVHDELLAESPQNEALKCKTLLIQSMEHAVPLSVPLRVQASIAKSWGDLYE